MPTRDNTPAGVCDRDALTLQLRNLCGPAAEWSGVVVDERADDRGIERDGFRFGLQRSRSFGVHRLYLERSRPSLVGRLAIGANLQSILNDPYCQQVAREQYGNHGQENLGTKTHGSCLIVDECSAP